MVFAGIPYHTFADFHLGPLTIRSFGTIVGIGVIIGAWVAARYIERWGVPARRPTGWRPGWSSAG